LGGSHTFSDYGSLNMISNSNLNIEATALFRVEANGAFEMDAGAAMPKWGAPASAAAAAGCSTPDAYNATFSTVTVNALSGKLVGCSIIASEGTETVTMSNSLIQANSVMLLTPSICGADTPPSVGVTISAGQAVITVHHLYECVSIWEAGFFLFAGDTT